MGTQLTIDDLIARYSKPAAKPKPKKKAKPALKAKKARKAAKRGLKRKAKPRSHRLSGKLAPNSRLYGFGEPAEKPPTKEEIEESRRRRAAETKEQKE